MATAADQFDARPSDAPAPLTGFNACTADWFAQVFSAPTRVQQLAWPHIAAGRSTLLFAPTGSGKTLAAFLALLDTLMFPPPGATAEPGVKLLYVSPLKALGADVDRNLRAPLAGITGLARARDVAHRAPTVALRTGDTPARERAAFNRNPSDILITTPESLYLMLTSKAAATLTGVRAVIIDEIHSMVPTKRGAHLFLSLERLEHLRRGHDAAAAPLQRIGLSATQKPLEEVAALLGGAEPAATPDAQPRRRPVEIVDAAEAPRLELSVRMPLEAQAAETTVHADPIGNAAGAPLPASIWPAIYPQLVELVRAHRSTMIFVNSRRLAERIAGAINETADEDLARPHHGSLSRDARLEVEDALKQGRLRAIVATSSLELGIDMGAVDLVIQIEAPNSVASGLQRIGRAGHSVGMPSRGIIYPKYRGDLLASAAVTARMVEGRVEQQRYLRNPLDVLAQQIVAMVAIEDWHVDALFATVRAAAAFRDLPRGSFDEVLNLISGRYPADEFAALRPRITWDRLAGTLSARRGAQRTAILNAGTIPDRGLYGVFLASAESGGRRVGELDEEMVYELQVADVFRLGASTWRVIEINRDQVLVEPAPGEPGKMPFWRGDGLGRSVEFGQAIGALTRRLAGLEAGQSAGFLTDEHLLEQDAAQILLDYVHDQRAATAQVPTDRDIVIEAFTDEVGDWRVVLLSPFGARVHAPWAMCVAATLRQRWREVDVVWTDDGIVFRLPEVSETPEAGWFLPPLEDLETAVINAVAETSMYAARFRENAARALLLPRRQPDRRVPLWLQRRKAADLLGVASRFPQFPILLETYRECLQDIFDLPGLTDILRGIDDRRIRVHTVQTDSPSPFAQSVLFDFTAGFIYETDTPLAERRAQALALDHAQLRELLGGANYRELLDPDALDAVTVRRQRLDAGLKCADHVHDLLLALGELDRDELMLRVEPSLAGGDALDAWLAELTASRRICALRVAGRPVYAAVEDAARYRDATGAVLPLGLPGALLEPVADAHRDLVSRFARTRGAFRIDDVCARLGMPAAAVREVLETLAADGRVLEGEFTPGASGREWIDAEVLRTVRRQSLASWRKQIEPVEPAQLARFIADWQQLPRQRRGLDGLLDAIEQLQGTPLLASTLETEVLPVRVADYRPAMLDELMVAGEVLWRGLSASGPSDGRIALYLTDQYPLLGTPAAPPDGPDDAAAQAVIALFAERGALGFDELHAARGGMAGELAELLWDLVWSGHISNDSLGPLRVRLGLTGARKRSRRRDRPRFRSRRASYTPGTEGRWSLLPGGDGSATEQRAALVTQLLERYGVLTREAAIIEGIAGGFPALYPVLSAMEDAGTVRRGYFVDGLGASQFALPGAVEQLRGGDDDSGRPALLLAATDPACAWGALLPWPASLDGASRPQRGAGARVIMQDGRLLGWLNKSGQSLTTFLPEAEPELGRARRALATALAEAARPGAPLLLASVDGVDVDASPLAGALREAGFEPGFKGYRRRVPPAPR